MIGTERRLFEEESQARARLFEYAKVFSELHVIVFTTKVHNLPVEPVSLGESITLYPTHSRHRLLYVWDAFSIGLRLLTRQKRQWAITTQDPYECGFVGMRLLKRLPQNLLHVQVHTDLFNPAFAKEGFLNKLRVTIATSVFRSATCVRVVSKRIAASITDRVDLRSEPYILPIFVDVNKYLVADTADVVLNGYKHSFTILVASRLEVVKNIDVIIKAFAALPKPLLEKAGVVIVGDGTERKELEILVHALGVAERVTFVGWQTQMIQYYQSAQLFVNASSYEGYCLSVIEAALCKCPVLTTDVGAVGDVLPYDYVTIADLHKKNDFKKKLEAIISAPEKYQEMANMAHRSLIETLPSKEEYEKKYREGYASCG